jgi:uncharacterized protein YjiS (DUF1127 family)
MIMLLSTTRTSARFSRSVGRAMLAGAEAVRTLLKRRRTYGSLSALDDRMLHDIGLHRSMLLGVALHGVKSAREAAPLAKAAAADQRPTLTAAIARVLFEMLGASLPTSSAGSRRRSAPRS